VRLDEVMEGREDEICMLKVDVEGYEPQAFATARRLLRSGRLRAIQLEMTKGQGAQAKPQMRSSVAMLQELTMAGFIFKQVPNEMVDYATKLSSRGQLWSTTQGTWEALPSFPSSRVVERTRRKLAQHRRALRRSMAKDATSLLTAAMPLAYSLDFRQISTNLVGRSVGTAWTPTHSP
jgi:hypothetical protein